MAFLLFGRFDQRRLGMRIGDCESRVGFAARISRPPEFRGRDLYCSVRCCLTIVSEVKRDVGGGFLAGTCRWSGPRRELGFGASMGTEEMLTVTFQKFIALGLFDSYERRETVRRI